MRRQLNNLLPELPHTDHKRSPSGSIDAIELNRSSHIGYILLSMRHGCEMVVEVKFHSQYLEQLVNE